MREIYVKSGSPRELAVVEEGKLCEYLLDDAASAGAETMYLGRVERIVPGMKAAFIDIGQARNGFLPLEERSATAMLPSLQTGDRVLVQVKREPQGDKGAFLTRDVTLCGQYVILMPMNRYIGVSSRVEEGERPALKDMGAEIADGRFGLIMRAASLQAAESAILEETDELLARWETIRRAAPTAHAPSMVFKPRTVLESLLDDYRPRGIDRLVTDDAALAASMADELPVMLADSQLMERAGLTRQRDKALERRVWLDCGGTLVIDPCEAMTVIDVNTAKHTGKKELEQTILQTNLEACVEIARQVRLRNLGGIILIDMIDMEREDHRLQVIDALKAALAADRVKTVVHGMTSLGLIEMTRKRSRVPLRDEWTRPCRACRGSGRERLCEEETHG